MQKSDVMVLWDAVTRETLLIWNSQVVELPERYSDEVEATAAAMAHCRNVSLVEDQSA